MEHSIFRLVVGQPAGEASRRLDARLAVASEQPGRTSLSNLGRALGWPERLCGWLNFREKSPENNDAALDLSTLPE
jgi:hypothetical protein